MNNNEFIIWLKGFLAGAGTELSSEQVNIIRKEMDNITPAIVTLPYIPQIYPEWPYPLYPGPTITWKWLTTSGDSADTITPPTETVYMSGI